MAASTHYCRYCALLCKVVRPAWIWARFCRAAAKDRGDQYRDKPAARHPGAHLAQRALAQVEDASDALLAQCVVWRLGRGNQQEIDPFKSAGCLLGSHWDGRDRCDAPIRRQKRQQCLLVLLHITTHCRCCKNRTKRPRSWFQDLVAGQLFQ